MDSDAPWSILRIAAGAPVGLARDLDGSTVERMADLVRRYLHAAGRRQPEAKRGTQTFDKWLVHPTL